MFFSCQVPTCWRYVPGEGNGNEDDTGQKEEYTQRYEVPLQTLARPPIWHIPTVENSQLLGLLPLSAGRLSLIQLAHLHKCPAIHVVFHTVVRCGCRRTGAQFWVSYIGVAGLFWRYCIRHLCDKHGCCCCCCCCCCCSTNTSNNNNIINGNSSTEGAESNAGLASQVTNQREPFIWRGLQSRPAAPRPGRSVCQLEGLSGPLRAASKMPQMLVRMQSQSQP